MMRFYDCIFVRKMMGVSGSFGFLFSFLLTMVGGGGIIVSLANIIDFFFFGVLGFEVSGDVLGGVWGLGWVFGLIGLIFGLGVFEIVEIS